VTKILLVSVFADSILSARQQKEMMMDDESGDDRWLIESVLNTGERFRPSDWIERISASLASFGADHRLHYSSEVQPCIIEGKKCLLVRKGLRQKNPDVYAHIMHFAEQNNLKIQEDRRNQSRTNDPLAIT
jgi:hypothetical protein